MSRYRLLLTPPKKLLGGDPARGDLRLTVELALTLKDLPRLSAASGADGPNGRPE